MYQQCFKALVAALKLHEGVVNNLGSLPRPGEDDHKRLGDDIQGLSHNNMYK